MTDITIHNDGLALAASVYGAADAPPILFLHGVSNSRDTWDEVVDALADRFQVWTLDFRGHGHSGRAPAYDLAGYKSDAAAVLAAIGRPAVVVGHSLGGCVAGLLAQDGRPDVCGVFLEDPPWFLGEPDEWARSAFPPLFGLVAERQKGWQAEGAPLATYVNFVSNAPSPMGGTAADHLSPRHLLSRASGLQRQDNACWGRIAGGGVGGSALSTIDTTGPFRCPATIIRGEARLGAALLDGHEERLKAVNPDAAVLFYEGCGHLAHQSLAFADRFTRDLDGFLQAHAS